MSDLPEPLTPADCDLREFGSMPIDTNMMIFDSEWLMLSAEQQAARLHCMAWSWRNRPAASIPDIRLSARPPGIPWTNRAWVKHREAVLKPWVLCADGRLYHPWLAEHANESWRRVIAVRPALVTW